MIKFFIELYPIWAIITAIISYNLPGAFGIYKDLIIPLLGILMFGMGVTLSVEEIKAVAKKPYPIFVGLFAQFLLMPLIALLLCNLFLLPKEIVIGMFLVGCAPDGTAATLLTYIAKGNVALSVALTSFSTLVSVIVTPLLLLLYIGKLVPIPIIDMMISILQIILIPISLGILVKRLLKDKWARFEHVFPMVSVFAVVFIIGIIVDLNHVNLVSATLITFISAIIFNLLGFIVGYIFAKLFKLSEKDARTVSIEVAAQNAALSIALAIKFFSVMSALPGVIFGVVQNLIGPILCWFWSKAAFEENSACKDIDLRVKE